MTIAKCLSQFMKSSVFFLALVSQVSVYASQWIQIAKWNDSELFYDAQSFTRQSKKITAWIKIVFNEPRPLYPNTLAKETWDNSITDITFNCENKQSQTNQSLVYLGNQRVTAFPAYGNWAKPVPDSYESYAMQYLCLFAK